MIGNIKKAVELLKDINSNLANQLQYTNSKLEELEKALNHMASENQEPISLPDNPEIVELCSNITENTSTEIQEESAVESSEQVKQLQQKIVELEERVDKLIEENNMYKSVLQQKSINELSSIGDVVGSLEQNVKNLYSSDEVIYGDISEIVRGYQDLREYYLKVSKVNVLEADVQIFNELVAQLNSYSWVNTALRLGAYAKLDFFNLRPIVSDELLQLEKRLVSLYAQYGVEFIIPQLLVDSFDADKYEFDNDNTIWIEKYCNINPIEYVGKIYDIVQVGYKTPHTMDGGGLHKPIVYYN